MRRDLEPCYFSAAEFLYFFLCESLSFFKFYESSDNLSVFLVCNACDFNHFNLRHLVKKILDFTGIDILTSPDDHVLDPTGNPVITFLCFNGKITGMKPAILINCKRSSFGVFVVPFHYIVATAAYFSLYFRLALLPCLRIEYFHLNTWIIGTYCCSPD